MKKFPVVAITLFLFFVTSSIVHADFVTMTLAQPKYENLKGWKVYYAIHVTDQAPDPAVTVDVYDTVIEWVGFTAANVIMPIVDREWGLTVIPYPGYESTHWEVELTFYLPGSLAEENKTLYFISTATGQDGEETAPSAVYPFVVTAPGQAEAPVVGYKPGTSAAPKQLRAPLLLKSPPTVGSGLTIISVKTGE